MVKQRWSMLLIGVFVAACAARTGGPPEAPKPSREALAAKPIEWSQRERGAALVPASVKRLQMVITPGWEKGEHLAWLISDGTEVIAVYHSTGNSVGEIVDAVAHVVYASEGGVADRLSWVLMGAFNPRPPPPPPGPGGMPQIYVEQVMGTAWRLNRQAEAFAGESITQ